nr:hypothetical protein [Burkholderia sp. IMCC1007]
MTRCGRARDRKRREGQRGGRAAVAGRVVVGVGVGVGVGVAGVAGVVMRRMVMRTRRSVPMPVAVCVVAVVAVCVVAVVAAAVIVPRPVGERLIVIMAAATRLRTARCAVAMRVLAGRRRRVVDRRRLRVACARAAGLGAVGMTVSWVVGTLGVGHDNLLYG